MGIRILVHKHWVWRRTYLLRRTLWRGSIVSLIIVVVSHDGLCRARYPCHVEELMKVKESESTS